MSSTTDSIGGLIKTLVVFLIVTVILFWPAFICWRVIDKAQNMKWYTKATVFIIGMWSCVLWWIVAIMGWAYLIALMNS